MASVWSGENEDICPSIKKSIIRLKGRQDRPKKRSLEARADAFSRLKMTPFAHGGISINFFVIYVHILNESLSHKFHPFSILST